MADAPQTAPEKSACGRILGIAAWKLCVLENIAAPVALLAARLYVGMEFWRSGTDKIAEGWDHAKDTFDTLFRPEYETNHVKHWLGMDISFPIPPTAFGAFGSTYVEMLVAVLLIAGFAGRLGAVGIFLIALNIKLFVYPDDDAATYWMLITAILATVGPGKISIDYFIRRKLLQNGLCDKKTA